MKQHYATSWKEASIRPTGFKRIRKLARDRSLSVLQLFDRAQPAPSLRCLSAHYVFDDELREFDETMRMLQSRGRFVDTETCVSMLNGHVAIDEPFFHLSFDDGFKNIVQNAVPILYELGIPAAFFVPSDFIDVGFDEARRFAMDIARYNSPVEMCSWDDLRTAMRAGIEIGSHTRKHARLADISESDEALDDEVLGSKHAIERELGVDCRYFAYPYGKPGDHNARTLAAVDRAGYSAGFGIHRGQVVPGETNRFLIPRHHFEPEWPRRHVRYFANGHMEDMWARKLAAE